MLKTIIQQQKTEREAAEAAKETGCKELLIVTYDRDGNKTHGNQTIKFVPIWRFLLGV